MKISIFVKFIINSAFIISILVGINLYSILSLEDLFEDIIEFNEKSFNDFKAINDITNAISKSRYWNSDMLMTYDPDSADKARQAKEDLVQPLVILSKIEPNLIQEIKNAIEDAGKNTVEAIGAQADEDIDKATEFMVKVRNANTSLDANLGQSIQNIIKRNIEKSTLIKKQISDELIYSIIISLLAVFGGLFIAYLMQSATKVTIKRNLKSLTRHFLAN